MSGDASAGSAVGLGRDWLSGDVPLPINCMHAALIGTSSVLGQTESAGGAISVATGVPMTPRRSRSTANNPAAMTATSANSSLDSVTARPQCLKARVHHGISA